MRNHHILELSNIPTSTEINILICITCVYVYNFGICFYVLLILTILQLSEVNFHTLAT